MKSSDTKHMLVEQRNETPSEWYNEFRCETCIFQLDDTCKLFERIGYKDIKKRLRGWIVGAGYCPHHRKTSDMPAYITLSHYIDKMLEQCIDFCVVLYVNNNTTEEVLNSLENIKAQTKSPQYIHVIVSDDKQFVVVHDWLAQHDFKYSITKPLTEIDPIYEGIHNPKATWTIFVKCGQELPITRCEQINDAVLFHWSRQPIRLLNKDDWHGMCLHIMGSNYIKFDRDGWEQIVEAMQQEGLAVIEEKDLQ